MKKLIFAALSIIAVSLIAGIYIYAGKVDTKYAIEYAQVFGSYDIRRVDQYLNEDTVITFDEYSDTYKNLRGNVIAAFEEQKYTMGEGSSYGHGDDVYNNGVQTVGIQTYIDSELYSSDYVSMELKRRWFVCYEVQSLTSSDDFFGYLFFGVTQ